MSTKAHWQSVYSEKGDDGVSWTQQTPSHSLSLIDEFAPRGSVIDVGGGASSLVRQLLESGRDTLAVLDIAPAALERAKARLGAAASRVRWIVADVTFAAGLGTHDVWHDRALFHFLTECADRRQYVALVTRTVPVGGHAVIATFAPDGPATCSGLDVARYDGAALGAELGGAFRLLKSVPETHLTPWGTKQRFQYSVFRRSG